MVALIENPGTIEEIAKFFKKKRANSADLDINILFFVHISITSIRVSWRFLKSEQTFHKSSFLVFVTNIPWSSSRPSPTSRAKNFASKIYSLKFTFSVSVVSGESATFQDGRRTRIKSFAILTSQIDTINFYLDYITVIISPLDRCERIQIGVGAYPGCFEFTDVRKSARCKFWSSNLHCGQPNWWRELTGKHTAVATE